MRVSKGYWFWGQFDESSTQELTELQAQAGRFLQGPTFDIHLTLAGPMGDIDNNIVDLFFSLKEQLHEVEVQCVSYGCREKYYQSLFIEVLKSEKLTELKNLLDKTFALEPRHFFPHISLFYGEEQESKKNSVISQLPKVPNKACLKKVSLVKVDEEVELWKVIHQIEIG